LGETMPLFIWKGVDEEGVIHAGRSWAPTVAELERSLLQKSLALVERRLVPSWALPHSSKKQFFFQVGQLLQAHIPLYQALLIVATTQRGSMRSKIEDIAQRVARGSSFSSALRGHQFVDSLTNALICMGEATGSLATPLQKLTDYWSVTSLIATRARSALIVPGITFVFFLAVIALLLVGIVPRFEQYFTASGGELPWMTQILVRLSAVLRAQYVGVLGLLAACALGAFLGRRHISDSAFFIPGIAAVLKEWWLIRFLQALEILLKSGIPLSEALEICALTIGQKTISRELALCKELVDSGKLLSDALKFTLFSSPELESYIAIGETSSELGRMVGFAAYTYQERLFNKMQKWVLLINPLLLMVLGGCIAALIVALYLPVMGLADSII
jgi:type IV pilus assembly protein PilC